MTRLLRLIAIAGVVSAFGFGTAACGDDVKDAVNDAKTTIDDVKTTTDDAKDAARDAQEAADCIKQAGSDASKIEECATK